MTLTQRIHRGLLKDFFRLKLWVRRSSRTVRRAGMTSAAIAEAMNTWCVYPGWEGGTCFRCGLKANVLAGGTGWFCDNCGEYMNQLMHGGPMPNDHPDDGPDAETIGKGHALSDKIRQYREECK